MVIIEVLLGYRNTFEETRDPWPWVVRPVVGLYRATPHDVPVRPCARTAKHISHPTSSYFEKYCRSLTVNGHSSGKGSRFSLSYSTPLGADRTGSKASPTAPNPTAAAVAILELILDGTVLQCTHDKVGSSPLIGASHPPVQTCSGTFHPTHIPCLTGRLALLLSCPHFHSFIRSFVHDIMIS